MSDKLWQSLRDDSETWERCIREAQEDFPPDQLTPASIADMLCAILAGLLMVSEALGEAGQRIESLEASIQLRGRQIELLDGDLSDLRTHLNGTLFGDGS